MQSKAPELVDISGETAATLEQYGIDQKETRDFGMRCLRPASGWASAHRYDRDSTETVTIRTNRNVPAR